MIRPETLVASTSHCNTSMFNQYQILASKNAKKLARAHRAPSRGRNWGVVGGKRLLHRLAADLAHPRYCAVGHCQHCRAHLFSAVTRSTTGRGASVRAQGTFPSYPTPADVMGHSRTQASRLLSNRGKGWLGLTRATKTPLIVHQSESSPRILSSVITLDPNLGKLVLHFLARLRRCSKVTSQGA